MCLHVHYWYVLDRPRHDLEQHFVCFGVLTHTLLCSGLTLGLLPKAGVGGPTIWDIGNQTWLGPCVRPVPYPLHLAPAPNLEL